LSNPQNAELNVNASRGTGTIIDSDAMSTDTAFNHNWGTEGVLPRLLNVQVVIVTDRPNGATHVRLNGATFRV